MTPYFLCTVINLHRSITSRCCFFSNCSLGSSSGAALCAHRPGNGACCVPGRTQHPRHFLRAADPQLRLWSCRPLAEWSLFSQFSVCEPPGKQANTQNILKTCGLYITCRPIFSPLTYLRLLQCVRGTERGNQSKVSPRTRFCIPVSPFEPGCVICSAAKKWSNRNWTVWLMMLSKWHVTHVKLQSEFAGY